MKGICVLLDAWQQCDLCSMACTLQKRPQRCCAILLRNGNLYGWNIYSICLLVKKIKKLNFNFQSETHFFFKSNFTDFDILRYCRNGAFMKSLSDRRFSFLWSSYKYYYELNRLPLPKVYISWYKKVSVLPIQIVKSNVSRETCFSLTRLLSVSTVLFIFYFTIEIFLTLL